MNNTDNTDFLKITRINMNGLLRSFSICVILLNLCYLCYSQSYKQKTIDQCRDSLGDFKFLKVFEIYPLKSEDSEDLAHIVFSYIFTKDREYKVVLCEGSSKGIENLRVVISDPDKKFKVRSYDKKTKQYTSQIIYQCKATGVHYMHISFECNDSFSGCAYCILGFRENG